MTQTVDRQAVLARLPLFQLCTPAQLADIAESAGECVLERGQFLFHKGDRPGGFFIVVQGQIKLLISAANGDEKVVELIGPQSSFGEAVMFLGKPYPVSAMALTDAVCLAIRQATVDRLLAEDPAFARRLLAGLSIRLHGLIQDVAAYSMLSGVQRVIGYLLQSVPEEASGAVEVALPTTKFVIASRLNITPETLSRVFHELTSAGLIEVRGRRIAIPDLPRLRAYGSVDDQ